MDLEILGRVIVGEGWNSDRMWNALALVGRASAEWAVSDVTTEWVFEDITCLFNLISSIYMYYTLHIPNFCPKFLGVRLNTLALSQVHPCADPGSPQS